MKIQVEQLVYVRVFSRDMNVYGWQCRSHQPAHPGGPWDPNFGASPAHRRQPTGYQTHASEDDVTPSVGLVPHQFGRIPALHRQKHGSKQIEPKMEIISAVQDSAVLEVDAESSRATFEEWLENFSDQDRRYTSPVVMCEVQYNEILKYTDGWEEPNMLKTAACSVLFDKLIPCYALKRDCLLERLKNDLMYAVYSNFSPKVAASSTYYDHEPFFRSAIQLEKGQSEVERRWNEMVEKEKLLKVNSRVVKSVDGRRLEFLQYNFLIVVFNSWVDLLGRKHDLVEKMRSHVDQAPVLRAVRQLFQDWKLVTATGMRYVHMIFSTHTYDNHAMRPQETILRSPVDLGQQNCNEPFYCPLTTPFPYFLPPLQRSNSSTLPFRLSVMLTSETLLRPHVETGSEELVLGRAARLPQKA